MCYYSHPSSPAVFQLDLIKTFPSLSLSLSLSLLKAVSRQEMEWLEVDSEAIASLGRVLAAFSRCLTSFIIKGPVPSNDVLKFRVGLNL